MEVLPIRSITGVRIDRTGFRTAVVTIAAPGVTPAFRVRRHPRRAR